MSFAGAKQFDANLRKVMDTKAFKEADFGGKMSIGYRLLNSKYGKGSFMGFGSVKELPDSVKTCKE